MFVNLRFIVFIVFLLLFITIFIRITRNSASGSEDFTVYGIMITGKEPSREKWAKRSIFNWLEQDCSCKKHLIIINHGNYILGSGTEHTEYRVKKDEKTLGNLRNFALSIVKGKSTTSDWWTVWDDDDIRSHDYLTRFLEVSRGYNLIALSSRIEYNLNNGFIWGIRQLRGLPFVLCKCDIDVEYLDVNTMEDVSLIKDVSNQGYRVLIWKNDPRIYIRTVHTTNTSLYVNSEKKEIKMTSNLDTYQEFEVSDSDKQIVLKKMS